MDKPFPFFLELSGSSISGGASCDENDPVWFRNPLSSSLDDPAKTAADTISHNRSSELFRGDETEAERLG